MRTFGVAVGLLLVAAGPVAVAATSELPPGARLGPEPVTSEVQFRALDSFWRGNASHVDLYNVRLETKAGATDLANAVMKIYVEDGAKAKAISDRFEVDQHLLPYAVWLLAFCCFMNLLYCLFCRVLVVVASLFVAVWVRPCMYLVDHSQIQESVDANCFTDRRICGWFQARPSDVRQRI